LNEIIPKEDETMSFNKYARDGYVNIVCTASSGVSLVAEDVVEIVGNMEVNKPSGAGSIKIIGEVEVGTTSAGGECTIGTRGRKMIYKTSGAAVAVGPVVDNGSGKVIAYASQSHSAAAIIGWALSAASDADESIPILLK